MGVHTAVGHALVNRVDDHRHAFGGQRVFNRLGDLRSHFFLNLQALGVEVHQPRQFRNTDHPIARDIGDMGDANDRQHVMLAGRLELDVLEQDHVTVVFSLAEGSR